MPTDTPVQSALLIVDDRGTNLRQIWVMNGNHQQLLNYLAVGTRHAGDGRNPPRHHLPGALSEQDPDRGAFESYLDFILDGDPLSTILPQIDRWRAAMDEGFWVGVQYKCLPVYDHPAFESVRDRF